MTYSFLAYDVDLSSTSCPVTALYGPIPPLYPAGSPVGSYVMTHDSVRSAYNYANPSLPAIVHGAPIFDALGIGATLSSLGYFDTQLRSLPNMTIVAVAGIIAPANSGFNGCIVSNYNASASQPQGDELGIESQATTITGAVSNDVLTISSIPAWPPAIGGEVSGGGLDPTTVITAILSGTTYRISPAGQTVASQSLVLTQVNALVIAQRSATGNRNSSLPVSQYPLGDLVFLAGTYSASGGTAAQSFVGKNGTVTAGAISSTAVARSPILLTDTLLLGADRKSPGVAGGAVPIYTAAIFPSVLSAQDIADSYDYLSNTYLPYYGKSPGF